MKASYYNNDIVVLDSYPGLNFATRFIKALTYTDWNYKFDYFIRVDDDYYICVNRLIQELKLRYQYNLFWGVGRADDPLTNFTKI